MLALQKAYLVAITRQPSKMRRYVWYSVEVDRLLPGTDRGDRCERFGKKHRSVSEILL